MRSRPAVFIGWIVTDDIARTAVHTNKIRLHWIELKQTLEEVIYRWDAACRIVPLYSITTPDFNVRRIA